MSGCRARLHAAGGVLAPVLNTELCGEKSGCLAMPDVLISSVSPAWPYMQPLAPLHLSASCVCRWSCMPPSYLQQKLPCLALCPDKPAQMPRWSRAQDLPPWQRQAPGAVHWDACCLRDMPPQGKLPPCNKRSGTNTDRSTMKQKEPQLGPRSLCTNAKLS